MREPMGRGKIQQERKEGRECESDEIRLYGVGSEWRRRVAGVDAVAFVLETCK
jgi:hypothetical protein